MRYGKKPRIETKRIEETVLNNERSLDYSVREGIFNREKIYIKLKGTRFINVIFPQMEKK